MLKRLQATNFAQHDTLDIKFSPGLTGVIGPCGTGKSNMLRAIKLALTGEVKGRTFDELIQQGKDEAHVSLDFTINGEDAKVERRLSPSGNTFRMTLGNKEYTSVSSGYEALFSALGATSTLLQDVVFCEQGQLDALVSETESVRKATFQRFFGLEIAEKGRRLLKEELNNVPPRDHSEELKEAQSTRNDAQANLQKLQEKLDSMPEPDPDKIEELEDQLASIKQLQERVRSLKRQKADALSTIETLDSRVQTKKEALEEMRNQRAELLDFKDELETICATYQEQESVRNRLPELRKEATALRQSLKNRDDGKTKKELEHRVEALRTEKGHLKTQILGQEQILRARGEQIDDPLITGVEVETGECPTCGATEQNWTKTASLTDYQAKREQFIQLDEKLCRAKREARDARENTVIWEQKEERLREVEEKISEFKEINLVSTTDYEEAQRYLQSLSTLETKISSAESMLPELIEDFNDAQERKEQLCAELEEVDVPDEADRKALESQLQKFREQREQRAVLRGKKVEAEAQTQMLQSRIERLEAKVEEDKTIKAYRKVLTTGRELLHRDRIPSQAARSVMGALNDKLAFTTEEVDCGFTAWFDKDTFAPVFVDADNPEPQPHYLLSGGQGVILAICTVISMWELFLENCDLLVLDEPTQFLDGAYVSALIDFMGNLRTWANAEQNQILLVTHNERLKTVVDQVVTVG